MLDYIDNYPSNYDFLADWQKEAIIAKCLDYQDIINRFWDVYLHSDVEEIRKRYFHYHKDARKEFDIFLKSMAAIGIMAEYDWPGHRKEWFLATYADYEYKEDVAFQNAD